MPPNPTVDDYIYFGERINMLQNITYKQHKRSQYRIEKQNNKPQKQQQHKQWKKLNWREVQYISKRKSGFKDISIQLKNMLNINKQKQPFNASKLTRETFELAAKNIIDIYAADSKKLKSPSCIPHLTELVKQAMKDIASNNSWKKYIQSTTRCLPNGFVAMPLLQYKGYVLRLHQFNQNTSVDGLHSHKWDFESMILCGKLNSENWSLIHPLDKNINDTAVEQTTTAKFLRKREEGDTTKTTITLLEEEVHLKLDEKLSVESGECYFFPAGKIHRVMKSTIPTATLVLTHPKYVDAILYDQLEDHAKEEIQIPDKMTLAQLNQFIDICINT